MKTCFPKGQYDFFYTSILIFVDKNIFLNLKYIPRVYDVQLLLIYISTIKIIR